MAIILRGKNKGIKAEIHQWCNDWFMLESGQIVSPGSIQLTPLEIIRVTEHDNNGILFGLYKLTENGRFIRRRRGE